ncbi:hypothetical protein AMELA_G00232790 [Ameiurus melas]|uniref:Uncharacterized protein n=1 Tax=Ameiurus melas TaxID=219545 RepID=A0A7J6A011_AMEME|nr:hypothetical protein AMELA_G00232790 [Ameiurus melas]
MPLAIEPGFALANTADFPPAIKTHKSDKQLVSTVKRPSLCGITVSSPASQTARMLRRESSRMGVNSNTNDRHVNMTWTLCGTPEYLAPEVIQSKGHGRAVDWWALGVLIFEMLSGYPPFFDDNPFGIYQKILAGKLEFPRHLDFYVKDLVKKFLVIDRARRLGNMKNGAEDVKKHRWFKTVDWDAVPNRKLKPPIIPKVSHEGDTSNFEAYPEDEWKKETPVSPKDLEIFKNF